MGRGLDNLHPAARTKANELVQKCKDAGLNILITETFRTKADQDKLYSQGRSRPGKIVTKARYPTSLHNWGTAFDFCRNERGREYDNKDHFFDKVGVIGKSMGLVWGGDFTTIVDKPHFQLKEYTATALKEKYGTPETFMQSWDAKPAIVTIAATDKQTIQQHCKFTDPLAVWALMDKHPHARALYQKWAESYGSESK